MHTCTFDAGKTYKCAKTVFTILRTNQREQKLKLRTLQGLILEQLLLNLQIILTIFCCGIHFQ